MLVALQIFINQVKWIEKGSGTYALEVGQKNTGTYTLEVGQKITGTYTLEIGQKIIIIYYLKFGWQWMKNIHLNL